MVMFGVWQWRLNDVWMHLTSGAYSSVCVSYTSNPVSPLENYSQPQLGYNTHRTDATQTVQPCDSSWPSRRLQSKYGFCTKIYTIQSIAEEADKLLFRKMMSANHCIHFLLPSVKSTKYCLRPKGHPYELPRCEYELHKKVLYSSTSLL